MAKAAVEDDDEAGEAAPLPKKSGIKKIILIVVGALALVGVSVGGTLLATGMFSRHDTAADAKVAKAKQDKAAKADDGADAATSDNGDNSDAGAADAGDDNADANAEDAGSDNDGGDGTAEAPAKVATYFNFDQPFVVNFQDGDQIRYLQVTVSVMSHDPKMSDLVKHNMPLIRNNLIMLFSSETRDQIMSPEGKEKIRADAQAEVQKVLKDQTGKPVIEALYFTSFVMQ